jgi:AcrR family transcriptional regulator
VVEAAADVADRRGLAAVSMRGVAAELGVEAMSLYHHVANKEALLDALADWVFEQVELPAADAPWRDAMRARAHSMRTVLSQHRWALGMLESRPHPGAPLLRHHDSVMGCLASAGFTASLATHAFSAIDAYVYGFALTESTLPFEPGDGAETAFADSVAPDPEAYPHLVRALTELLDDGTYAFAEEFAFGLDLILDGIERRLEHAS